MASAALEGTDPVAAAALKETEQAAVAQLLLPTIISGMWGKILQLSLSESKALVSYFNKQRKKHILFTHDIEWTELKYVLCDDVMERKTDTIYVLCNKTLCDKLYKLYAQKYF